MGTAYWKSLGALIVAMLCAVTRGMFMSPSHRFASLPRALSRSLLRMSGGQTSSAALHKVIFVLGGPGAGKGTQCARLVDDFGLVHLSAGELLRQERASGSPDGQLIEEYLRDGRIVPVSISLGLLQRAMDAAPGSRFLIDGFPRNWDNVDGWEELMKDSAELICVLFLDCPEEEQQRRLLLRGETSGRSDDNLESARKRFQTFHHETMPVVKHFEALGLVKRVPAAGTPEEVYSLARKALLPLIRGRSEGANEGEEAGVSVAQPGENRE